MVKFLFFLFNTAVLVTFGQRVVCSTESTELIIQTKSVVVLPQYSPSKIYNLTWKDYRVHKDISPITKKSVMGAIECAVVCYSTKDCATFSYYNTGCWLYLPKIVKMEKKEGIDTYIEIKQY